MAWRFLSVLGEGMLPLLSSKSSNTGGLGEAGGFTM